MINAPRGTRDILPGQTSLWKHVIHTCEQAAVSLSFSEIRVPTFEDVALFQRSLGEGTDIIDKELFLVRGRHTEGEQYALRPEGTAGIVRAYIQHGMRTLPQPVRLYSILNLFRYERPQRGRYREHVQFDIEQFGSKDPSADAWVILTQWTALTRLGLGDAQLSLNSLGTTEEREFFREQLIAYFKPLQEELSEDSKRRLSSNPLRILDSKDPLDQPYLPNAPHLIDSLGNESRHHLDTVCTYLKTWGIAYTIDPFLVRGLDYYCQTCFEWSIPSEAGRPLALGGGGRYDSLLPALGGPDSGAVGAGLGLDRLVDLLEERGWQEPSSEVPKLAIVEEKSNKEAAAALIPQLVSQNIALWTDFSRGSLSSQLKAAAKEGCTYALFISEQGLQLKDLRRGAQQTVRLEEVKDAII